MKNRFLAFFLAICICLSVPPAPAHAAGGDILINGTNFPDETFRAYVSAHFDKNNNGVLSLAERNDATEITLNNQGIASFNGIEHLSGLQTLNCSKNPITELNLRYNFALQTIYCNECDNLERIDLPACKSNSEVSRLETLVCESNNLYAIDNLNECELLKNLFCKGNNLYGLRLSGCVSLEKLDCSENHLRFLKLDNCPELNQITANQKFSVEYLYDPEDVRHVYEIDGFTLDIYPSDADRFQNITGGTINSGGTISCTGTQFTYEFNTGTTSTEVGTPFMRVTLEKCVHIDETTFPDANFRSCITDDGKLGLDANHDGSLTGAELEVTGIDLSAGYRIRDLTGIEHFHDLDTLNCENNELETLDVSRNTSLTRLDCNDNDLTHLSIGTNPNLLSLYCYDNLLTGLDVSAATGLQILSCGNNALASLDISKNTALQRLFCANNKLRTLDVTKNTALVRLNCSDNELAYLDLSNNSLTNANCTISDQHLDVPYVNGLDLETYMPRSNVNNVTPLNGASRSNNFVFCSSPTFSYAYDTGNGSLDKMTVQMHSAKYDYGVWKLESGSMNKINVTVNTGGQYVLIFARYSAGRMTLVKTQTVDLVKGSGRNSIEAPFQLQAGDKVFLLDTDRIPVTAPLTIN